MSMMLMEELLKEFEDGSAEVYTYTKSGMYETVQDLRGITKYQYDLMDRLVKVENPDGSWIEYSYDRVGNKTSVKTTNGKTTYEYDALNRLVKVTDALGNETMYTYDSVATTKHYKCQRYHYRV